MNIEQILTEYADEGVLVVDLNGTFKYANVAFSRILEIEYPVIGKTITKCFLEKVGYEDLLDYIFSVIYEEAPVKKTVIKCSINGKEKTLLALTSRFVDEVNEGILLVITDISEYSRLQSALGKFISPVLAEKIIKDPNALKVGSELKMLTVIMSDLRGFTAISEKLIPEDLIKMLNHYFGEMTKVIKEYEGTVIEFIGDGIVATFGAPIETKNHASLAVGAALAMQDEMKKVNQWNVEMGYPQLSMGISISTGETVVGNIGCDEKMEYDVIGRDINLCGRLEGITAGGEIVVSEETYNQCEKRTIKFDEGEELSFKGISEPVKVYRVMYGSKEMPVNQKGVIRNIKFSYLQQKTITTKEINGELKFVSTRRAFLKTDYKLSIYDNICLDEEEEIYAKVVGIIEEGYILDFTYLPESYKELEL